ncbi:MAG: hypothetical protein ACFE78_13290 [Candidatus Hodarchaeota archaeon]
MLLAMGGIFIFLTKILFIRTIPYMDILITLLVTTITLLFLLFIIPGIVKIIKKINFSDQNKSIYFYALAPLIVSCLLLYTIIIAGFSVGASIIFIDFYFRYFFIALGGGMVLNLIIIALWWLY